MKRLLLLGGGHAQLAVLASLARQPLTGWETVLLTPEPAPIYSGMLPGWVAGRYTLDQCRIDLRPLAAAAGARLIIDAATQLDADARRVVTASGQTLNYDLLSLDVGSAPATPAIAGADQHARPVRPIADFVVHWQHMLTRLAQPAGDAVRNLVVLGAGAGGVELAFSLRERVRLGGWPRTEVHLVGSAAQPLATAPPSARTRVQSHLTQRAIAWHGGHRAVSIGPDALHMDDGSTLAADACWLLTGPAPHAWLEHCGLALDAQGFVAVNATLQSVSHSQVFAAGDTASLTPPARRSGVYAVRAGPWLARNLLAHAQGQSPAVWQPQARALYLLSTGDGHAIATWGGLSLAGRWAWCLKDWIDRSHVARWSGPLNTG